MSKNSWLKKYTKLEYLEETLGQRKLYLGDPSNWDDKNDRECILRCSTWFNGFKARATSLTGANDRYHFWHIYGEREKGACLWFNKSGLCNDLKSDQSLISNWVQYPRPKDLANLSSNLVPFIKREQFKDERGFRILRVNNAHSTDADMFRFSARSLERIYINPWLTRTESNREKS